MRVALVALSVVGALAFLAIGAGKVFATGTFVAGLGLPSALVILLGVLEIAGAIGLLTGLRVRSLGLAAAVGLVLLLLGAVGFHLLNGDLVPAGGPALVLLVVAAALTVLHVRSARPVTPAEAGPGRAG